MKGGQALSPGGLGKSFGIVPTGTPSQPVFFEGTPTPTDSLGCVVPTPTTVFLTSFSNSSYNHSSTTAAISSQLSNTHPSHPSFFLCQFMPGHSLSLIGQFRHRGFDPQSLEPKHTHHSPDDIPATTVFTLSADQRPAGHQDTQAIPSSSSRLACVVTTPTRAFFSCYCLPFFNHPHHTPLSFLLFIYLGEYILTHQTVFPINVSPTKSCN